MIDSAHKNLDIFAQDLTLSIWKDKYRYKDEETPYNSLLRVADGLYLNDEKDNHKSDFVSYTQQGIIMLAGRIQAGAGTMKKVTLLNCLEGEEKIITDRGVHKIKNLVNKKVNLLTKKGYVSSEIKAFGIQKIQTITFQPVIKRKNGVWARLGTSSYTLKVKATKNHRWPLTTGLITDNIKRGDRIQSCGNHFSVDEQGWLHGFMFGDGNHYRTTQREIVGGYPLGTYHFQARLCGNKIRFIDKFQHITYPLSYNGEPIVYIHTEQDFKILPDDAFSPEYKAGFIQGWLDADGHKNYGSQCLSSQDHKALDWVELNAPYANLIVTGRHVIGRLNTGYYDRKTECISISFKPAEDVCWEVDSIESGETTIVYCAIVPEEQKFALACGIYTGNCYVMQNIPDSMSGIADTLKHSMLTMQQGGGIGLDFSTLRPTPALLINTDSIASGPMPFMHMWNSMCKTIMSSGSRRGAMMATMICTHPNLPQFIEAKHKKGVLTNFNMSVLITDEFVKAVKSGLIWDLYFDKPPADENYIEKKIVDGKTVYVYSRWNAVELWNLIIQSTYDYAEPGVIFIDRINHWNNLSYCETITATNPCFAPGTLITTRKGLFPVEELIGKAIELWDGNTWTTVNNFCCTGIDKSILQIELQDGSSLKVTTYHTMILENGETIPASYLKVGDNLQISLQTSDGSLQEPGAYMKGFFIGDGSEPRPGRAWLALYEGKECCKSRLEKSLSELVPVKLNTSARIDINWNYENTGTQSRQTMTGLAPRKTHLLPWLQARENGLPVEVFQYNRKSKLNLIAGYFDADGTAADTSNGYSYQVTSTGKKLLLDFQTLLKTLGVMSKVSPGTNGGLKKMPGGTYNTKPTWRLTIAQKGSIDLSSLVTFERLKSFSDRKVKYNSKPRMGKIVSIQEKSIEKYVYCCNVETTHQLQIGIGIMTGQCGEQPLPPFGACDLGAINLARLVKKPFTDKASFDYELYTKCIIVAVRALDNVLDVSDYPIPQQEIESQNKRRIGLGVSGLANMLAELKVPYNHPKAAEIVKQVMSTLKNVAYTASINLARERSSFPAYNEKKYLESPFIKGLNSKLRSGIKKYGIRNGVLLTIAPTGTTSIYFGNISSGLEPVYQLEGKRFVIQPDGSRKEFTSSDYGYNLFKSLYPNASIPSYIMTADQLLVEDHLRIQAICQANIDASISKTINCPESIEFDAFRDVYFRAYELGCKGCTTYRPSSTRGSIFEEDKESTYDPSKVRPRPSILSGKTYKLNWPPIDQSFYITINDDEQGRPFEIFISSTHAQYTEWTSALTLMITAILRRGGDVSFIAENLKQVVSPTSSAWVDGKYQNSLVAMIGETIEQHMNKEPVKSKTEESNPVTVLMSLCPKCNSKTFVHQEGCGKCLNCDYTSCG